MTLILPFSLAYSTGNSFDSGYTYREESQNNKRRSITDSPFSPHSLRLKSPLNTQEAIQIVKATCRRLIRARINDCHRRLNYYNDKIQQRLDKLKQLLATTLLCTIQTIADKRANKTAEQHRAKTKQKLTRLQDTKNDKRRKPDANWVRNISSRPLDETATQVLSYGFKHSVTPKQIPTEAIVSSVEAVLSRQHELSESTKDNIRSRATSTLQSASLPNSRKKSRKHLND